MAKNTQGVHPRWNDLIRRIRRQGVSRRQFLGGVAGTSDVHRGVIECTTTIPRWLPPLLGQPPVFPYPTPPAV